MNCNRYTLALLAVVLIGCSSRQPSKVPGTYWLYDSVLFPETPESRTLVNAEGIGIARVFPIGNTCSGSFHSSAPNIQWMESPDYVEGGCDRAARWVEDNYCKAQIDPRLVPNACMVIQFNYNGTTDIPQHTYFK